MSQIYSIQGANKIEIKQIHTQTKSTNELKKKKKKRNQSFEKRSKTDFHGFCSVPFCLSNINKQPQPNEYHQRK